MSAKFESYVYSDCVYCIQAKIEYGGSGELPEIVPLRSPDDDKDVAHNKRRLKIVQ